MLDVRWRLDRPDGRPDYRAGHVPGAQYVALDHDLAAHGAPTEGRHPLPSVHDLQATARRWGIDPGDTVVVYDDANNMASARAWWLLRYAGLADVRLLDGALRAWTDAGYEQEEGDAAAPGAGTSSSPTAPCPHSNSTTSPASPPRACCSTRAPRSDTAGRPSPSTRARDTCRAR